MEHHLIDEIEVGGEYDQNQFLSRKCQTTYYLDLVGRNYILREVSHSIEFPRTLLIFIKDWRPRGGFIFPLYYAKPMSSGLESFMPVLRS